MTHIEYFNESHISQVHQLYQKSWWAKTRTLEDTAACIDGSQLTIGIVDRHNNVVGFTRVITDFIFKAIIFDVIVDDSAQGEGIGQQLMALIKQHEKLQHVKHFELYCLPNMRDYYAKLGFCGDLGGIELMRFIKE